MSDALPTTEVRYTWLLLAHQLPPKPAYFRVKVWRRLQRLGAISVKNSVYVLPASEQALEDFQWLLREVEQGGGEGMICEANLVDGLNDLIRGLHTYELPAVAGIPITRGSADFLEWIVSNTAASVDDY